MARGSRGEASSSERQPLLSVAARPGTGGGRSVPSSTAASRSASSSRPTSAITSPPNNAAPKAGPSRSRPPTTSSSVAQKKRQSSSSSRSPIDGPTPTSSANSSRRSSVVLDSSAYRYSLNVGSISRFPAANTADVSGSGAHQILAAERRQSPRIGIEPPSSRSSVTVRERDDSAMSVDPSRASMSSISSRGSSRMSSRYMAEEVAPQRRPIYLALPSDPSALGPWSNTQSTVAGNAKGNGNENVKDSSKSAQPERRNSKIMTSFPFPHPVTPRRRADRSTSSGNTGSRLSAINNAWQRLLTAIFAGPYERQLLREEQEDDRITESIIADIAERRGSGTVATGMPNYGAIPVPKTSTIETTTSSNEDDPNDPYGYRRMAGPHLLPSYTTDLVARRRERRRARSRARFQCMALWTIWTVAIMLLIIVGVIVFSWYFPDKLDIPSHHDEGDDEDADSLRITLLSHVLSLITPRAATLLPSSK